MDKKGVNMNKFFKDILTGVDKQTYDQGRVTCLMSFISYYIYAAANLVLGHPWQALDFAGGLTAIAVGFGIHLKLKSDTEPQATAGGDQ